jgi:hypothetical protein
LCVFIVLAILLITSVALFEKWYVSFAVGYPIEQAQKAYKQSQFDEAITILERLDVTHPLNAEQRVLLNDIYLAKSEYLTQRKIFPVALSTLGRISHDYARIAVVEQRRAELLQLIEETNRLEKKRALSVGRSRHSHASPVAASPAPASPVAASPVAASSAAASPADRSERAFSKQAAGLHSEVAPTPNVVTPLPIPVRSATGRNEPTFATVTRMLGSSLIRSHSSTAKTGPRPSPSKENREPSRWHAKSDLAQKDAVQYNELLAGYFSRPPNNSEVQAEPPSLHEWIEQGKPNF